jgi:2-polyprenyl-3-methyl-5-hydroxy-6-metoxy-1,4-benzoquinol methylase
MTQEVYDSIAKEYQDSKSLPFRLYVEEHTLFSLIGDIHGLKVLDLACGEGIYARKLKRRGAEAVTGVDISAEMIRLARAQEDAEPLGLRYAVMDAAAVEGLGSFDVVVGAYLLNYAKSRDELRAFASSIFRSLKSGGRFVAFNDNPANDPKDFARYRKYGFEKKCGSGDDKVRREGDPITYTLFNPDGRVFSFVDVLSSLKEGDSLLRYR